MSVTLSGSEGNESPMRGVETRVDVVTYCAYSGSTTPF